MGPVTGVGSVSKEGHKLSAPGGTAELPGTAPVPRRMLLLPPPSPAGCVGLGAPSPAWPPGREKVGGWGRCRGAASASSSEGVRTRRLREESGHSSSQSRAVPAPRESGVERSEPQQRPGAWAGVRAAFAPGCPGLDTADARPALGALGAARTLLARPGIFENFRGRSAALRLATSQ